MTMHSAYFMGYALVASFAALVMAHGYYIHYKRDGAPVNYTLLTIVFGVALFMWTGVAVTEYAYNPSAINTGLVTFFLAIWLSAGIAWQVTGFMKRLQTPRML